MKSCKHSDEYKRHMKKKTEHRKYRLNVIQHKMYERLSSNKDFTV